MLKAVFFDAAGTLLEPRNPIGQSYARMAARFGVAAEPAQVSAAFRRAFHETPGLAFGPGHEGGELRRLEREWWRGVVARTFDRLERFDDFDTFFDALFAFFGDPANWRSDPAAAAILKRLRARHIALGVLSNFDYRLYGILDGLGLGRYFDSITISSEAGYAKPAPEIFRIALDSHGVAAGEAIHVGDSDSHDLAGARAVGMPVIIVAPELEVPVRIEGGYARVRSLGEIEEAAKRMGLA